MTVKRRSPKKRPRIAERVSVVPKQYAGQWIVWDASRTRIVASGKTLVEAQAAARTKRERSVGYEWIPPANRRLIGASL